MDQMRADWFGDEPAGPGSDEILASARVNAMNVIQESIIRLDDTTDSPEERAFRDQLESVLGEIASRKPVLRIALMGRTQAGKSTLFEFLTGGSGELMGKGGQRTTRQPLERPIPWLERSVLIDTPGVGAADGEEDRVTAFGAALRSDVVLWVATDDSTQEETAKSLREIAQQGKPLIVFMNCRRRIDSPALRSRLLDKPDLLTRDIAGHWARLDGFLEPLGVRPAAKVTGHALAALESAREGDAGLRQASLIQDLVEQLREQEAKLADHLVLWSTVDAARGLLADYVQDFQNLSRSNAAQSGELRKQSQEFEIRLRRRLDEHTTAAHGAFRRRIDQDRTWYSRADLTGDINEQWSEVCSRRNEQLTVLLKEHGEQLNSALQEESEAFQEDWELLDEGAESEGLKQRNVSAWANRAVKAAALAGPGAGVAVVIMVANPALWPALAMSAAAFGAVLALKKWVLPEGGPLDRVLPSRKAKREQYRREIREDTARQLDQEQGVFDDAWRSGADSVKAHLRDQRDQMVAEADALQRAAECSREMAVHLRRQVWDLDTQLARAALGLQGRRRLAGAVRSAVLVPGVAMAVYLSEAGFDEIRLFPLESEPIHLAPVLAEQEDWKRAADIVMGASKPPFLIKHTDDGLIVSLGADFTGTMKARLEKLAYQATGVTVSIRHEGVPEV